MITTPIVNIQCDQEPNAVRCLHSQVFTLPSFEMSREQVATLFLALHSRWGRGIKTGAFYCPECRVRAQRPLPAQEAS